MKIKIKKNKKRKKMVFTGVITSTAEQVMCISIEDSGNIYYLTLQIDRFFINVFCGLCSLGIHVTVYKELQ